MISLFTEIQKDKLSLLYFLIEGTSKTEDIEGAMNSNLALGLYSQIFINSNENVSNHILLALKAAFSSNKKQYNKELKLFSFLHSQTRSELQERSISNNKLKENLKRFPLDTPKKNKKIKLNPQSEKLKQSNSLGIEVDLSLNIGPNPQIRSTLSQKQIQNKIKGSKLGLIFGNGTSISSDSKTETQVR